MTDRETSREATDAPEIAPGLFHRFFEDSTDAIVVTDREGKILTANPAWLSLYGYRLEEVAGRSTSIVKSPHTTPEMYRYMWSKIGDPSQGFWKGEIVNRKRDGTEVPVLLTITPIRDRDGGIAGYTGIGIDMTERRRAEEMRELYEMVVRHDLKTPLGSILALAETLREGYAGPLDERQRDLVSRIVGSALRMREMIETGLDLKRFERGVLRLDPADIDLLDIVRRSADGLAPLAREREVVVAVMAGGGRAARPEDRLPLRADPVHLQRAIDNLVKNAIEASPRGGDVVVTAAEVKRADAGPGTSPGASAGAAPGAGAAASAGAGAPEARRVRIAVHNGGAPIPPDVRATLFHPFSTYGKRGGTGLGIYGVRTIVEAMGGTVSYDSGEDGTTFEIVLPAEAGGGLD